MTYSFKFCSQLSLGTFILSTDCIRFSCNIYYSYFPCFIKEHIRYEQKRKESRFTDNKNKLKNPNVTINFSIYYEHTLYCHYGNEVYVLGKLTFVVENKEKLKSYFCRKKWLVWRIFYIFRPTSKRRNDTDLHCVYYW